MHRSPVALACAVGLLCAAPAAPARAQALRPAHDTRVRSVEFRFIGRHVLNAEDLSPMIATRAPDPLERARSMFAWLPWVEGPEPRLFDPLTVHMDRERLRRHYRREGFLQASVDYEARISEDRRHSRVTFVVAEGPPLTIRSVELQDSTGATDFMVPQDIANDVPRFVHQLEKAAIGARMNEANLEEVRRVVAAGLANRGYPGAHVETLASIDSAAGSAHLVVRPTLGPRVRVSGIEVEGVRSVTPGHVVRQFPIAPGDLYSRRQIEKGRDNVLSVPLFSRSRVLFGDSVSTDSSGPVRVVVTEAKPRITNLELGYVTDGAGVTGQIRWTHPNFTGGARSLDALALFQTGWGSTTEQEDKLVRVSVPLTQPHVGSPNASLSVGPAYEYRDDAVDRSTSWSGLATLVYRFNPLQSAALRYEYTYRKLEELRVLEVSATQNANYTVFEFGSSALLDSLKVPETIHDLTFFTSLGKLDDISRPRHGAIVKPNLSVTLPFLNGDVDFARADVQFSSFFPVPGRTNALSLRGKVGGLWPTGASVPQPGESPVVDWLRLRDEIYTAGGSSDVRGYDNRLLGAKVPSVEARLVNGDTVLTSDSYVPVGGLRRVTASAELRLGIPSAPPNLALHLFGDVGRVWTTDPHFIFTSVETEDQHAFYTCGGGIGYYTPVGAIRLDMGYKLNPSLMDLRAPQDVLEALRAGQPIASAPVIWQRRYAILLSLGLNF